MLCSGAELIRERLETLLCGWRQTGIPSRSELCTIFQEAIAWKEDLQVPGLWDPPPLMLTATLDDGWGQGLQIIEWCARAAGFHIVPLGLLQPPDKIIAACREHSPEFVGLTMLHLDSEPDLAFIGANLPPPSRLLAGGPAFRLDPDLAGRAGVHLAARSIADFLEFLLKL